MLSEEWKQILDYFIESGLSQKAFCQREGIDFTKFKYQWYTHRHRLGANNPTDISTRFEPIVIQSMKNDAPEPLITLNTGITLKFPNKTECQFEFKGPVNSLLVLLKEMAQ